MFQPGTRTRPQTCISWYPQFHRGIFVFFYSCWSGLLRKNIFWMQYFRKQNKSDICRISWYPLCIGIEIDNFCQIHIATWYLCTLWWACSKLKVSYIMGYNPTDRTEKLIHNLELQWQSRTNWSIAKCRHQTVWTVSIFYWFNIQRNLFTAVTQSYFLQSKNGECVH